MKKFLSLLLGTAMLVSLAACGGGASSTAAPEAAADDGANDAVVETVDDDADEADDTDDAAAPAASGDLLVVGYSQIGAESDWRTANTESFKSFFVEENGYKLIFNDAQQKQENQIAAIRDFIAQEVDYIVVAPVIETGWETVLQEAKDAGIPVILSDREMDVDEDLYVAWVGGDFVLEGEKGMNWLGEYLAELGRDDETINIIHLQGTMGSSAQIGRTEGILAGIEANPNYNLLESQTGEFTQAKGQEVMESMLKAYDNIDVVIAENDNMGFGAIDAISAAGMVPGEDIIIITFDSVKEALERIVAGEINCSVECSPLHAPRVGEIIQAVEAGETVAKKIYPEEGLFDINNAADELPTRPY